MSDKKQSSAEWLEQQFQIIIEKNNIELEKIWQQLKAMHKEEQRLTYEGVAQNLGTSIKESDIPTFEEYYNETYGGQDNE